MAGFQVRRTVVKKHVKPAFYSVVSDEILWGLAALAHRVNQGYVRYPEHDPSTGVVRKLRNLDVIRAEIDLGMPNLTSADLALGREARFWHQGRLSFKMLSGVALSDFERTLAQVLEKTEFWSWSQGLEISIAASQIASYQQGLAQELLKEFAQTAPVATLGTRVEAQARVIKSVYSQRYDIYFVTAFTSTQHMIFFSYRKALEADTEINLVGTVKAHRTDTTQLTRVKLFDK